MKDAPLALPFFYKIANGIGTLLVAARLPFMRLDEDAVCAAASRQAGLTDFGDPHFRPGLQRLLESAEADANLHPIGRFMTRDIIINYLVQRLRLVETRKNSPEIFQKHLHPPLIIAGLARSGTTFLHSMLALDPDHRALPQWLLMRPFPEAGGNDDGPDPRIEKMEQANRLRKPLLPGIDAIHYSRADTPEECILMLGLTFNSLIFGTLLPVYGYMDWYLEPNDTSQKYREYRWLLNVFQSHEPKQRLTLKAPAHTGNLESLVQAVPNAMVVQTYRDPVTCVSSVCSLIYTYHLAVSRELDVQRMANLILKLYEVWFRRNLAFRRTHPDLVYDVFFDSLVSDPIRVVRDIYSRFGLRWTKAYESSLNDFVHRHPKHKHGKHSYAASDFGLAEAEIRERLGFYSEYFGL